LRGNSSSFSGESLKGNYSQGGYKLCGVDEFFLWHDQSELLHTHLQMRVVNDKVVLGG